MSQHASNTNDNMQERWKHVPLTHEERLALINKPFPVIKGTPHSHASTHGVKMPNLAQLESDWGSF